MDKVRHMRRDLSLRKSLMLYVVIFVMLALTLSVMTASLCNSMTNTIRDSYPISGEKYYLTNEQGEQLGDGAYISDIPVPFTEQDERVIALLALIPIITTPLYSASCIIAAALLFYRNKLKKPLAELRAASEKISNNDLDFSIEYDSRDELGQLCTSFEIMRAKLANNFSEMWREASDRKQLNAAFAHDLRTPLTVLKGYDEMLQASDNIQTRETAATMGKHISRMETYVTSMSNLQRLEDTQPEYKSILLQPFLSSLCESAEIVCMQKGKRLCRQNKTSIQELSIDTEFVSQVCNNLIANAVRYACTAVTLTFEFYDSSLQISVSDDGKGFHEDVLHKAVNPYFTEEQDHSEHFGLGLYICKLLCEHHGGCLQIENIAGGAKVNAIFKVKN
ncbi:MAG: HAMP domain-containing histidine kinase [Lachnospiraceae bacterium]|nr:HAMP domain-containing histidine kinase [Lachnospiraceae bacterium]